MYEELTDAEYWKIARLHLSEEDMEKVRAWRSTSDRNVLQLWEIYDDVLTLRIHLEEPIKALREYAIPHPSYREPNERTVFALRQAPPKLSDWQDYIVLARERRDVRDAFTVLKLAETDVTGIFAEQTAKIVSRMQAKEFQLLENDTAPEVAWKVYIKHKAFGIRNENIPNITLENAVPDFPRKVTYRTVSKTETERTVTYFPEDVREKKNTEDYGQPIAGGTIIGTESDNSWKWIVTRPAELDTCKSRIYANAVIGDLVRRA